MKEGILAINFTNNNGSNVFLEKYTTTTSGYFLEDILRRVEEVRVNFLVT